ncbi:LacI family DNA-binding transcriptional regulator [Candidatus Clostridium stratigraminis]|uniref:LacI family DNA-binding transcriptional regulator n=1 Tax=Candidatus Clostridium stratigraminis TaxID=3381661 RepID=A0ABW8T1F6_9CLOT
MVTIYDVAKLAGCSPATVSKVFNNYNGVNELTYKKVMDAAEELEYIPNTNARALATRKTWLIGVLLSEDVGTGIAHPHFSGILQSFQSRAWEYGYDVLFVNKKIGNKEESYLEHCLYRGVDGVLLAAGATHTHEIQCVLSSDLKCVSVEMVYPGKYTVISDNRMGTMQALEYLYFLGHRKIAHIACPLYSVAGKERYAAYKEFLKLKGIEENPNYVVEAEDYVPESGARAASKLLQQCIGDLPTAVYIAYDEAAVFAMTTFQAQGFRIPEDLSVVGFDNLRVSGLTSPSLTTIEQDRETIGKKAADTLIKLIENRPIEEDLENRVPTKLIVRNSCMRI